MKESSLANARFGTIGSRFRSGKCDREAYPARASAKRQHQRNGKKYNTTSLHKK
jgi:hypothetical protein